MAVASAELPKTRVASEMEVDSEVRLRAGTFIGQVAANQATSIEALPVESPIENLKQGIDRAYYEGDKEAEHMVEINVRTDVIERTIKTGHVMEKVPLNITAEGKVVQHGQIMDSIQANSLRFASNHPIMRARTEAETRNAFRIEQYFKDGLFENYSMLVVSRAENLPEQGFFTETMSCSLQLIGKSEGALALESAFVAGIAAEGEVPHDEATAAKLGQALGADYVGLSPAEIIDIPILIRNDLIPNGVIDIVKLWDGISGTFFGEDRPSQNYQDYLDMCREREALFEPKVKKITQELISAAPVIHKPIDAVRLLNDLSGFHMVDQAIMDHSIDSRVFGLEAARYIEASRQAIARGDLEALEENRSKAKQTENSNSCPSGMSESKIGNDTSNEDDDADCDFVSKECPLCQKKNVRTKVQKLSSSGRKRISGSCGCVKIA